VVEVNRGGYVPRWLKIRSRIDDTIFTADLETAALGRLEKDPQVKSVAVSMRLRPIT
jgi:hypothetical protein